MVFQFRILYGFPMMELSYTGRYIIGAVLLCVGVLTTTYGGFVFKEAWDDQHNQPNIVLRKVAFFWIEFERNVYRIGAVIRLFNLGSRPYLVNGVALNATKPQFYGRGGAYIQRVTLTGPRTEIIDDNFIKPENEATFKMLSPIRFEATIEHPPPPGINFVGQWALILRKGDHAVQPEFFGTFDRTISLDEWESLTKPTSTISIDNLTYEKTNQPPHNPQ